MPKKVYIDPLARCSCTHRLQEHLVVGPCRYCPCEGFYKVKPDGSFIRLVLDKEELDASTC